MRYKEMTEVTIVGPFPPPFSGTTIKNQCLADSIRNEGCYVHQLNTIGGKAGILFFLVLLLINFSRRNLVISVSKNGRAALIPYSFIAKRIFRKKVVLLPCGGTMPDELRERRGISKFIYSTACNSIETIFVETHAMAEKLKEVIPASNVQVQYNFKPRPRERVVRKIKSDRAVRLVYLGRMREDKGIFILLEAVNYLCGRYDLDVTLDFYGNFLDADRLAQLEFHKLIAASSRVRFRGYLEPSHIIDEMTQYDILVFPTFFKTEGFPGVLIDAAYSGLPVVATDIAYNSEIVKPGVTGNLCRPKDSVSLANAIYDLCLDEIKRKTYGENNWHRSVDFDAGQAARRVLSSFEKREVNFG